MNALTVLCLAVAVASGTGQLVGYPQVYGYPGILSAYPGFLPSVTPITLKTVAPSPFTLKTVAPAPITFKNVASEPITIKAASPITYNVAPVAPVAPIQSKFHAQDELGQYSFGYAGGPASRAETRDAFGIVRGSYNYVDPEGKLQTQNYVADALGFRVAGTNLPVAPAAPEVPALVGPEPVQDTPEVAAAKASFRSLLEKAAAAPETAAEPAPEAAAESTSESRKKRAIVAAPAVLPYASPFHFPYAHTAPLTYSHPWAYSGALPAVTGYTGIPAITAYTGIPAATTYAAAAPAAPKDATLLRVENNPGHAVSYRVD
ncbi:cuticle protein-like [Eriocheir sinensis]|uniref:cuticle protein-like n=1 Tax=Eriocheir sinensis TaxID=95602 RepID=UPI0021C89C60|nr:cuticle protein-like [Eriocheir sinensis]